MASNMSENVDGTRTEPSNVMQVRNDNNPNRQNNSARQNMNNSGNKQRFSNNQEQQNRYALNKQEGRKSESKVGLPICLLFLWLSLLASVNVLYYFLSETQVT